MSWQPALRARMTHHLNHHARLAVNSSDLVSAAVMVVVCPHPRDQQPAFLITKRAKKLRRHSGQWALPGGRVDHGESTTGAGLRELEEELGVRLSEQHVLGYLDDYATRSGFSITPLVCWLGNHQSIAADPHEVDRVYHVPLSELYNPRSPELHAITESDKPVLSIPIASLGTSIYAPTAAVLYQFREIALEGRSTRVDIYDQPLFAWS